VTRVRSSNLIAVNGSALERTQEEEEKAGQKLKHVASAGDDIKAQFPVISQVQLTDLNSSLNKTYEKNLTFPNRLDQTIPQDQEQSLPGAVYVGREADQKGSWRILNELETSNQHDNTILNKTLPKTIENNTQNDDDDGGGGTEVQVLNLR